MQIISFNFDKIMAERKSREAKQGLKIESSMNIREIEEEKIPGIKDQQVMRLVFDFSTTYDKDYARIDFTGTILIAVEKGSFKTFLKMWKEKNVDEQTRIPVVNLILTRCNLRSLQLEDELGLPLHIPLPKVMNDKEMKSYTG